MILEMQAFYLDSQKSFKNQSWFTKKENEDFILYKRNLWIDFLQQISLAQLGQFTLDTLRALFRKLFVSILLPFSLILPTSLDDHFY